MRDRQDRARRLIRSILAVAFGVMFVGVVIEIGFRVAHVLRPQLKAENLNETAVRIIVLGESTSAGTLNRGLDISWPRKLEIKLNNRFAKRDPPITFQVLNLARAASSSPFQVALLKQEILRQRADILISMIGVNDARVHALGEDRLYANSYLVRFLYWAEVAFRCPKCQNLNLSEERADRSIVSPESRENAETFLRELAQLSIKSISDLKKFQRWSAQRKNIQGADPHYADAVIAEQIFTISQQPAMRNSELERALLLEAKSLLDRSYREMVLIRSSSLEHYCHIRIRLRETGCVEAVKQAFESGLEVTAQALTIAAQEGATDDELLRKIYRNAGFEISREKDGGKILAESFRRLETIVHDHGIVWMPMQYPTGSVGALEFYLSHEAFSDSRSFRESFNFPIGKFRPRENGAILISNENFNSLVNPTSRESEYFLDFFGRDRGLNFGHTTEKGHDLIATNVADQIENSWNEIEPRIRQGRAKAPPEPRP